jgi:hypothetical protein
MVSLSIHTVFWLAVYLYGTLAPRPYKDRIVFLLFLRLSGMNVLYLALSSMCTGIFGVVGSTPSLVARPACDRLIAGSIPTLRLCSVTLAMFSALVVRFRSQTRQSQRH